MIVALLLFSTRKITVKLKTDLSDINFKLLFTIRKITIKLKTDLSDINFKNLTLIDRAIGNSQFEK